MKSRIIVLVLALLPSLQSTSAMNDPTDKNLINLSKAKQLESQYLGRGATGSGNFTSYNNVRSNIKNFSKSDLMWLEANSTPAGKVYAAFLMYKKDPADGKHYFLEFLDNDTPVNYQSGCIVSPSSVSEIGRSVVATGKFLDFDGTGTPPIYAEELSKAQYFADGIGGEGGRYLEWLVYSAANSNAKSLDAKALTALLAAKSPAGRLYAALLQDASGKFPKHQGLTKLLNDNAQVQYQSGCKGSHYTVGEVAKKLKDTGSFHNFKVQ